MFSNEQIIKLGKKIIQTEINGVIALKDSLSKEFANVCKGC